MIAQIRDPFDFETVVAHYFEKQGYEVIMPPANTRGYDIELKKENDCIAVQVKNHRSKCNVAQIQKFQNFLELPLADKFNKGWFVSASGYSNGKSFPRTDFLQLAEYLEDHTAIDELRQQEHSISY